MLSGMSRFAAKETAHGRSCWTQAAVDGNCCNDSLLTKEMVE